eukprot:scaffold1051_cov254-Pinguiococcus_pyrenoidosus.AAC.10
MTVRHALGAHRGAAPAHASIPIGSPHLATHLQKGQGNECSHVLHDRVLGVLVFKPEERETPKAEDGHVAGTDALVKAERTL